MSETSNTDFPGVYEPEILEFVRSSNHYCEFLEGADQMKGSDFIQKSVKVLSDVYSCAVKLGQTEPLLESGNEKYVTEEDWSLVYKKVLTLLGSHNSYLRIADDDEFDRSELVSQNISEDLADVYQDLKDFTLQYRQGVEEIMNDAVYEVMVSFENYWSVKLLNALLALNKLFISKIDPDTEMDEGNRPTYDSSFFTRFQDENEEDD
ncbi:MAG: DUF5063 domain-containing protein [Bacteroidales bacterium]|nr:DUF5063 domain-containing protein [Bacteroidales bacterium]